MAVFAVSRVSMTRSKGYPFVLEMAKAEKERVDAGGEKRFHFDFAGKFFEESEKEYFESYVEDNGCGGGHV